MTRVLIVEDSKIAALALKNVVEGMNMTIVGTATSGDEGVQMAKELDPDVVTMDINLPGMSGIEATEQILAHNPRIKVIVITEANLSDDDLARLKGAQEVLLKPVTKEKLQAAFSKL